MPSTKRFRCYGLLTLVALMLVGICSARLQSSTHEQASYRQPVKPSNAQLVDPNIERRVSDLLRRMTLEEKIGQLIQYNASQAPVTGPTTAALNVNPPGPGGVDSYQLAESGKLGSMLNTVGSSSQITSNMPPSIIPGCTSRYCLARTSFTVSAPSSPLLWPPPRVGIPN